jgi:hypothetical protein
MAPATKKEKKEDAYCWKAGASSRHITNLKQSILETFDIYGLAGGKESGYLYSKMYILQLTKTHVLANHFILIVIASNG